jgi:cysteine desulfurase
MDRIYLDHAATTPPRPAVRDAMAPVLDGTQGNPSSLHTTGRRARRALDEARTEAAGVLGVPSTSVFFVRGGTEANNLAISGWSRARRAEGRSPAIRCSTVEHSSVREAVLGREKDGDACGWLPVSPDGVPDCESLKDCPPGTLVCLMAVNHETGTRHALPEISVECRGAGHHLHTDAVQQHRDWSDLTGQVDSLSLSGHKIGAPSSTGLLFIRDPASLAPVLFGGGQEGGLRPGTEDVAGAVGLARALTLVDRGPQADQEWKRVATLRDRLESGLLERIQGLRVHGIEATRADHILSLGVPGLPRDVLPRSLDVEGIDASAGSACRSGSTEVSPVLSGYYGREYAAGIAPLRLSLGWTTTEPEIDAAIEIVSRVVERLRDLQWSRNPTSLPSEAGAAS